MVDAILFDLGDTLLHYVPGEERVLFHGAARKAYAYLQSQGNVLPSFEEYYSAHYSAVKWAWIGSRIRRREFNVYHVMRKLCLRKGYCADEAVLRELAWTWYEPIVGRSSVEPDVVPTLRWLRERGYKLGLVSNTFIAGMALDRHLEMEGLLEFFPVRLYSSEVPYQKPQRQIFHMALQAVGASAENTLFVGDSVKTDMFGARRVGLRTVLKLNLGKLPSLRRADYIISRVSDLRYILEPDPVLTPVPSGERVGILA